MAAFYEWSSNAGYGTKIHIEQIKKRLGTNSIHHRKSFEPIKSLIHS